MGDLDQNKATDITEAAQSITIHGLPHLFGHDLRLMKAFWFVIFIGAFGSTILLVYYRVQDYEKHEVYIKSESRLMQPIPFPAVTVCNSDRFSGKLFAAFNMKNITCNETKTAGNKSGTITARQLTEFKKACKVFLSGYKDTLRFGGQEVPAFPVNFYSSDGFYPCFTFNKNGLAKQEVNGAGKGLDMILFNDPGDVIDLTRTNMSRFEDQRRGILIQLHDPETEASVDPSSSIAISPGKSYEIVISRKTISRKEHPFPSKCHTSGTTLYKLKSGRYTRSNCIFSCFQIKLQQQCGDLLKLNKSLKQLQCETELYKKRPIGDCVCPEPCYEVTYPSQIATNIWPKLFQLKRMKTEFISLLNFSQFADSDTFIQKRFAKVKIYFQELINFDDTEEELYGLGSLISEIGGLMGLFIGCSVISLAELIWLFGLSIKSLLGFVCTRKHSFEQKEKCPGNNVELGSVNRVDRLVSMTAGSYNELVDSPSANNDRKVHGQKASNKKTSSHA